MKVIIIQGFVHDYYNNSNNNNNQQKLINDSDNENNSNNSNWYFMYIVFNCFMYFVDWIEKIKYKDWILIVVEMTGKKRAIQISKLKLITREGKRENKYTYVQIKYAWNMRYVLVLISFQTMMFQKNFELKCRKIMQQKML